MADLLFVYPCRYKTVIFVGATIGRPRAGIARPYRVGYILGAKNDNLWQVKGSTGVGYGLICDFLIVAGKIALYYDDRDVFPRNIVFR